METNALLQSKDKGNNEFDMVNKIINLGIKAKNSGTKKVYISSLLYMAGRYWTNMVARINNFLSAECEKISYVLEVEAVRPKAV